MLKNESSEKSDFVLRNAKQLRRGIRGRDLNQLLLREEIRTILLP